MKTKAQTKQAGRKRTLSGSKPSVAVPALETISEVEVSAPEPRVAPLPPFPVAGDIKLGTTRDNLYASYGQPTLSATTVDSGSLAETFVYSRQAKQGPLTVIRLRDGRVVSSNDLN